MVLGVVVLVVAVLALRNRQDGGTAAGTDTRVVTMAPSTGAPSAPSSRSATSAAPTGSTGSASGSTASSSLPPHVGAFPLIVLNNDYANRPHLAAAAARRFEAAGWTVSNTDEHYVNSILSTVVYYDPTVPGAKRAALALQRQFPAIQRVVERFAALPAGPLVVVLTSDYTAS